MLGFSDFSLGCTPRPIFSKIYMFPVILKKTLEFWHEWDQHIYYDIVLKRPKNLNHDFLWTNLYI